MYRPFQRDKEKNEFPNSRRAHTIMSPEDMASGKKSYWPELEITGIVSNISPALWQLRHLTSLYLNDNSLTHIPPDIANLSHLTHLDVSSNKLRILPPELGDLVSLKELLLNNNFLRSLPCELGRLFRLHNLGLKGNPLTPELFGIYSDSNGTQKLLSYLLDNLSVPSTDPPERPWVNVNQPCRTRPVCDFTVMCYNVLCDKYATRQMYGYCPSWALSWEYRRKGIMNEIRRYSADIISLQEVETEQFYNFFLPELQREGYGGIFSPKSRAKTMSEGERKHVDGCAIFYRTTKFTLIKEYLVEFNQLAMANAEGSDDMLNRVMTKDNIGLAGLFQIKEGAYQNGLQPEVSHGQPILVCTAHIHWDPEFCDVKLIQTMMLMHELRGIAEEAHTIFYPNSQKLDVNNIPLMLCGDFNSLPESGVIEFLSTGRVSGSHPDFKELGYKESLRRFSYSDATNEYNHPFRVSRTYNDDGLMPYTNYTCDFKGIIDYVLFSKRHITELGVLGPLDTEWMNHNKIAGCPHPHIPSDHFPLLVELELSLSAPSNLIIPNDLMLQR